MIGIIDYGSGNLRSVYNAFRYVGEDTRICENPQSLKGVDKLVLPGVGSSKDAMNELKTRDMIDPIMTFLDTDKPFLGICLGLQLLFASSDEGGGTECLNFIEGDVNIFPDNKGVKIPQIGWNRINICRDGSPILKGISSGSYFYFVHSYYARSKNEKYTLCETEYGIKYLSALWKDNIFAVQFHPERSQKSGLKLIENFARL